MKNPYDRTVSIDRIAAEEAVLRRFVRERRWERMLGVLAERTRYITVVVEDIYQPHNASAVLRSCDAFGVQDVHIAENRNRYRVNPGVELGTAQWLSLYRYQSRGETAPAPQNASQSVPATDAAVDTETTASSDELSGNASDATTEAIASLRDRGYRIVATTPHRETWNIETIPLDTAPIALFFGAEKDGLSDTVLSNADEYLIIPMRGFVESLNISVSAAITLQRLAERLRHEGIPWQIEEETRRRILNRWLRRSVKNAARILERELGSSP